MATKETGWSCQHNASIIAEDNNGVTIRVISYWKNDGWRYSMNNVSSWTYCAGSEVCVKSSSSIDTTSNNQASFQMGYHDYYIAKGKTTQTAGCYAKITSASSYVSGTKSSTATYISIAAKPSYAITYNANASDVKGMPGNATKWYNETAYIPTTKPTRTGYSFQGWSTANDSSVEYAAGSTYTSNAALTLHAVWKANTWNVKYNANGGTGAPGNQTKTYGVNLTLSSTKPTRTNYNFLGWSTSASGSVVYAAGASYTNNSAVTLYAVWELAYVKPRLNNFNVYRCTSNGTASDTGTYARVYFNWATDKPVTLIDIEHRALGTSAWTYINVPVSGTSGTVDQIIGGGTFSIETSYEFCTYVYDGDGWDYATYAPILRIGTAWFPIDIKKGGTGVAIGKVAENDYFEVNMISKFNKYILNLTWTNIGYDNKDYNDMTMSGTYYMRTGCTNSPDGQSYVKLLVFGDNGNDVVQLAIGVSRKYVWFRIKDTEVWNPWVRIFPLPTITLRPSARYTLTGDAWTNIRIDHDLVHEQTINQTQLIHVDNSGIKIGPGVSYVKVSGCISYNNYDATGETDLKVIRWRGADSPVVAFRFGVCDKNNTIVSLALSPVIVSVKEGDILKMYMSKGNGNSMQILQDSGSTHFTVEVVG